jgi:D-methionine transport system substrate-binding protein
MKKILTLVLLVVAGFGLTHVYKQKTCAENVLRVAVTAGPHARIMNFVKDLAQKHDVHIDVVEFNDFILPNEALHNHEVDVNVYQHEPFLNSQKDTRGYQIKMLGKSVLMPMGIYSRKYTSVEAIPQGSTVIVPNDPTNESRALLLLQKAGLIKLAATLTPTMQDIIENPKNIKIVELDAPQAPRTLNDAAAAVINTDWVVVSQIDPRTRIFTEDASSHYTNVIAAHEQTSKADLIAKFLNLYQSQETKDFVQKAFEGMVLPGW